MGNGVQVKNLTAAAKTGFADCLELALKHSYNMSALFAVYSLNRCDPGFCLVYPKKEVCTKSETGRMLRVSLNQKEILDYIESLKEKENIDFVSKHKEIVEHHFGTSKRFFGYTHFILRGMEKVKVEFILICFVHNLKRALNIIGVNGLMESLR